MAKNVMTKESNSVSGKDFPLLFFLGLKNPRVESLRITDVAMHFAAFASLVQRKDSAKCLVTLKMTAELVGINDVFKATENVETLKLSTGLPDARVLGRLISKEFGQEAPRPCGEWRTAFWPRFRGHNAAAIQWIEAAADEIMSFGERWQASRRESSEPWAQDYLRDGNLLLNWVAEANRWALKDVPGMPSRAMTLEEARLELLRWKEWLQGRIGELVTKRGRGADTSHHNQPKNVNGKMLETIQEGLDCMGWSVRKWALHLKCSKSSVADTPTWKDLEMRRQRDKAERARDRRRRSKTGR